MSEPVINMIASRKYGEKMEPEMLKLANDTRLDTYDRKITQDERAAYGESVIADSTKIEDLKDEKKETMKMYSSDIKSLTSTLKDTLKTLKKGSVETSDTLHIFFDHEEMKVNEYNSLGERTTVRRMNPQERQLRMPIND